MPKIKTITRNPDDIFRETKHDIDRVHRNYSPTQHPFQSAVEYKRATNAIKLERLFAQPYLGCLTGHREGVKAIACHPRRLSILITGAYDGEVRIWDLTSRKSIRNIRGAHQSFVRGLTFNCDPLSKDDIFASVGDDQCIKFWSAAAHDQNSFAANDNSNLSNLLDPSASSTSTTKPQAALHTMASENHLSGIDFRRRGTYEQFVTCGEVVQLWTQNRTIPMRSFEWGSTEQGSTSQAIRFNPIESHLFACCTSDRGIVLFDCRTSEPVRKVVLKLRSNALCWNPMEAPMFTCANEDFNLYSFDVRNLKEATMVHKDHVAAVMDVDYSPTGREFVSGSYDKTIRIFRASQASSREIYHSQRMQRVISVRWTRDARIILSGSDEMNIRLWKANASEAMGHQQPRQRAALQYSGKLKEKFSSHPEVSRIARHRHLPKAVYNAKKQLVDHNASQKRKEINRRVHSKPGTVPHSRARKAPVLSEE